MNAEELPLNQTVVVASTAIFRSTATRITPEIVELVYYDQSTNDETLKVHARVDGVSSELVSLDRLYWAITYNGKPITEADFPDLVRKKGLHFSVNAEGRRIEATGGA